MVVGATRLVVGATVEVSSLNIVVVCSSDNEEVPIETKG